MNTVHPTAVRTMMAADAEAPLRDHVDAALNSGDVSIAEMREAVMHFAV